MGKTSTDKLFLVGEESTRGTEATTVDKRIGQIESVTDSLTREVTEFRGIGSRAVEQREAGTFEPSLTANGRYQNGRVLYLFAGGVTHAETSGDWVHTYSLEETGELPTITALSGETTNTETGLKGLYCLLESLDISVELDGALEIEATFQAQQTDTDIGTLPSYPGAENPVFPHSLTSLSLDGTTVEEVQNLTLSHNFDIIRSGGLGTNVSQQIRAENRAVSFTAEITVKNQDILERFTGQTGLAVTGTPTKFPITFTADNGVELGRGKRKFTETLNNVVLTSCEKQVSVGDFTIYSIEGTGDIATLEAVDSISDTDFF